MAFLDLDGGEECNAESKGVRGEGGGLGSEAMFSKDTEATETSGDELYGRIFGVD